MSSNLLKRGYTNIQQDEKRVINTNELVAKRIQELTEKMQKAENEGFVSGLTAPSVEVEALLTDGDDENVQQSNVIKVRDEANRLLEEARKEADSIIEQARVHAMQLERDAKARAEQERMQMLGQAKQQGMQEGLEQAAKEAEKERQELKTLRKQLEDEYQQMSFGGMENGETLAVND